MDGEREGHLPASIITAAACFESTVSPPPPIMHHHLYPLLPHWSNHLKRNSTTWNHRSASITQRLSAGSKTITGRTFNLSIAIHQTGLEGGQQHPRGDCGYLNNHWLTSGSSNWGISASCGLPSDTRAFLRAGQKISRFLNGVSDKLIWDQFATCHLSSRYPRATLWGREKHHFNQLLVLGLSGYQICNAPLSWPKERTIMILSRYL